ncbi:SirB1 family protein, partial [Aetokthonos hydrillicola]
MNFSSARHFFFQEIQQPDECIDLAKAALYIAQEEYPELDPEEYLNALDTMAGEAEERLPYPRYPLRVIQAINQYLYDDLGFAGNRKDFYDPRNSFFNEVIDRRVGIPITLSLVYLEIARRIDFPMVGVGMPGHFLIRPDLPEMELFVDPFNSGEVMFAQDCQERLS